MILSPLLGLKAWNVFLFILWVEKFYRNRRRCVSVTSPNGESWVPFIKYFSLSSFRPYRRTALAGSLRSWRWGLWFALTGEKKCERNTCTSGQTSGTSSRLITLPALLRWDGASVTLGSWVTTTGRCPYSWPAVDTAVQGKINLLSKLWSLWDCFFFFSFNYYIIT